MKKNGWLILSAMLTTTLLAQQPTTPPPSTPPPAAPATPAVAPAPTTNAPAAKPAPAKAEKKKAAKKAAAKPAAKKPSLADQLKSIPLVPGTAIVVASNVNVRGQAGLKGEVLTKISIGDPVKVIEEVTLKNSKEDEPSAWAKIALPGGAHAWVNTAFINASNQTVIPKKLNVRGGPGENYSVIGLLEKGAAVKVLNTKEAWTEIEPPAGAYAFVAAQYLKQESPAIVATTPPPAEPAPTPAPVAEPPAVAPTTTDATTPPTTPPAVTPPPATPEPAPAPVEPPPPRVVQHEGIVKGTWSVQAPTKFALVDPQTGKTVNYLYTTSTNLDLHRYKGLHIVVTGEEGLDERWKNTPVITIQRIQVVE